MSPALRIHPGLGAGSVIDSPQGPPPQKGEDTRPDEKARIIIGEERPPRNEEGLKRLEIKGMIVQGPHRDCLKRKRPKGLRQDSVSCAEKLVTSAVIAPPSVQ